MLQLSVLIIVFIDTVYEYRFMTLCNKVQWQISGGEIHSYHKKKKN